MQHAGLEGVLRQLVGLRDRCCRGGGLKVVTRVIPDCATQARGPLRLLLMEFAEQVCTRGQTSAPRTALDVLGSNMEESRGEGTASAVVECEGGESDADRLTGHGIAREGRRMRSRKFWAVRLMLQE